MGKDSQQFNVGKSEGYWVEESDFIATRPNFRAQSFGRHGFPKSWPDVYTKSRALKSLIGKRGTLGGLSVHVVYPPSEADRALVSDLDLQPLQSFSNAEKVAVKTGMSVEKGWVVFELFLSGGNSCADDGNFVAQKHWFNKDLAGKPIDFSPRGPASSAEASKAPVLLVYGREDSVKERRVLTAELAELHRRVLAARGFPVSSVPASAIPPAQKIKPLDPKDVSLPFSVSPAAAAAPPAAVKNASPAPSAVKSISPDKAVAAKPSRRAFDYSKFDNIEDSDEEREKAQAQARAPPAARRADATSRPAARIVSAETEKVQLDDYRSVIKELVAKAEPATIMPDIDAMFSAFRSCPDTTDRALIDQVCYAVEGQPPIMNNGGNFDTWSRNTGQLVQSMLSRRRFDEARIWCIVRHMRLPKDVEPLETHAWCLEEQMNNALQSGSDTIRIPTAGGSDMMSAAKFVDHLQEVMRAHLWKMLDMDRTSPLIAAFAGLAASLERAGDVSRARQLARDAVKRGVWTDHMQRPAHFARGLSPQQPWHDAESLEICSLLEQCLPSISQEFETYMALGRSLPDVGVRSGEATLVERGSWKELPLFQLGRMDHQVCTHFPETVRMLTERGADATGLAFCGGGEIAFRVLSAGTRLKPHCGPTNARLTIQLGVSVPLGADPGVTVGDGPPRPWVPSKCIVFDDSYEHSEELDEMADGDCVVFTVHIWNPSFQFKNDPEWKMKGIE